MLPDQLAKVVPALPYFRLNLLAGSRLTHHLPSHALGFGSQKGTVSCNVLHELLPDIEVGLVPRVFLESVDLVDGVISEDVPE